MSARVLRTWPVRAGRTVRVMPRVVGKLSLEWQTPYDPLDRFGYVVSIAAHRTNMALTGALTGNMLRLNLFNIARCPGRHPAMSSRFPARASAPFATPSSLTGAPETFRWSPNSETTGAL